MFGSAKIPGLLGSLVALAKGAPEENTAFSEPHPMREEMPLEAPGGGVATETAGWDQSRTGSNQPGQAPAFSDAEPFMTITEFEPGLDRLEVTAPSGADGDFAVATAQLVEDTDAGVTQLILRSDPPGAEEQDLVIRLNATGVSMDDITFIGGHQPRVV